MDTSLDNDKPIIPPEAISARDWPWQSQPLTLSPFLPGTKVRYAWDSTTLGAFKTCPRLYELQYIDGWRKKDESVHFRFGSEYHLSLEQYDALRNDGVSHEDAIHTVVRELLIRTADYSPNSDTKAGRYKSRWNLVGLVVDYLDHFGEDDPAKTVILANGKPATELTFKFELGYGPKVAPDRATDPTDHDPQPYLLCGHLDRVVELNGAIMVMDRKTTTTTLSQYYFAQYEPNNQMSLYTIAGKVILGSPVKGVIIDAAQILLDSPNRFVRGFTYRTPDQTEEWLTDLRVTLNLAEAYAIADYFPMNDTACNNYGGCQFRDICSKSPQVRETFLKADFHKLPEDEIWNPLKVR